jgi:hypothetical protein
MIIISHRGNLNGPGASQENNPLYIQQAINVGFDVEIDVWFIDGSFFLGHDAPVYKIELDFLKQNGLWCHAKNLDALEQMIKSSNIHCFWHETDKFTLTSESVIWTYPGQQTGRHSVIVTNDPVDSNIYGVCTDYPFNYQ